MAKKITLKHFYEVRFYWLGYPSEVGTRYVVAESEEEAEKKFRRYADRLMKSGMRPMVFVDAAEKNQVIV